MIDIWRLIGKGKLKSIGPDDLLCRMINGKVVHLKEGFYMERLQIPKIEADNLPLTSK